MGSWIQAGKPVSRKNYQETIDLLEQHGVLRYHHEFFDLSEIEEGITVDAVQWSVEDPTRHGKTHMQFDAARIAHSVVSQRHAGTNQKELASSLSSLYGVANLAVSLESTETGEEEMFQAGIRRLEELEASIASRKTEYAQQMAALRILSAHDADRIANMSEEEFISSRELYQMIGFYFALNLDTNGTITDVYARLQPILYYGYAAGIRDKRDSNRIGNSE